MNQLQTLNFSTAMYTHFQSKKAKQLQEQNLGREKVQMIMLERMNEFIMLMIIISNGYSVL